MKELVTPKQVARAIGVSEASLKRWCDKGLLPTVRTAGGHRRLPINGVVQFLREGGHPLVRPEVLGLPPTIGLGERASARAAAQFQTALEDGYEEQCRHMMLNLYLAGHSACDICDRILANALLTIGSRWQHGDLEVYQERRACEICMRLLFDLRHLLPLLPADTPYAIGGTLESDPYTLPTTMAEVSLREAGWLAESHGPGNPAATLCAAIRQKRPRLFWLSVSTFESARLFLSEFHDIHETATAVGAAIVVGGRALTDEIRREMSYSAYCDNLRHLVSFARTLQPPVSQDSGSA
jgi:methanogenic corrinoid protein MtbC1